jgi:hypothetical protein
MTTDDTAGLGQQYSCVAKVIHCNRDVAETGENVARHHLAAAAAYSCIVEVTAKTSCNAMPRYRADQLQPAVHDLKKTKTT